jgi:hypothetical protein
MLLDNNEQQGQAALQLLAAVGQLRRQAIWLLGATLAMLAMTAILIARVRSPQDTLPSPAEHESRTTPMA